MILNILGLVQDLAGKVQIPVKTDIPFQQIIRSYQNLSFPCILYPCLPFPGISGYRPHRKLRRKPFQLTQPVIDQRSRRNNQRAAVLLFPGFPVLDHKKSNDLKSLSKSHIIGQDTAESAFFQPAQPFYPCLLIFSQNSVQVPGNPFLLQILIHSPDFFFQFLIFPDLQMSTAFYLFLHIKRPAARQLDVRLLQILLTDPKIIQQFIQFLKFGIPQIQHLTILQPVIFLFLTVGREYLRQFFPGKVICRHLKFQKIPGQRYSCSYTVGSVKFQFPQIFRNKHFSQFFQLFNPFCDKLKEFFLISGQYQLLFFRVKSVKPGSQELLYLRLVKQISL